MLDSLWRTSLNMGRVVSRQSSIRLSGCKTGYTTRQSWSDNDCSLALMAYTDAKVEIDGPTIVNKVLLAEHWAPPAVNRLPPLPQDGSTVIDVCRGTTTP